MTKLDAIDKKILMLLQHDARLTTKEMADKPRKSATAIYERTRWLPDEGYQRVCGFIEQVKN